MSSSIFVSLFHPFPTLCLTLPSTTPLAHLPHLFTSILPLDAQSWSTKSGHSLPTSSRVGDALLELRLVPKLKGGKGGFGSQLRAAGGRMSSQKSSNNDACRDLNGRRLWTIKQAKKLAAQIASEPERKALLLKEAGEKLSHLNAEIQKLESQQESFASMKRRLDDSDQVEQARESVEKLKSAVATSMMKKRKKQKLAATTSTLEKQSASTSTLVQPVS